MVESDKKPKFQELDINYKINVKVEKFQFTVPVGFGYKNITWLALCAAQQYSKKVYPQGHYLPCRVNIFGKGTYTSENTGNEEVNEFFNQPHPALRIVDYIRHIYK